MEEPPKSECFRGASALAAMRDATVELCDVTTLTDPEVFRFSSRAIAIGQALLLDSVSTGLRYVRTPAHIARGDMDHYLVSLCLAGEMQFASGRRHVTVRPGDICLVDMAQPNRTWLTEADHAGSRIATVVLPRAVLAPRLAHPDSATASVLRHDDRRAQLLAGQIAALRQHPAPPAGDVSDAVEAMAEMVAAAVGRAADTAEAAARADRHLLLAAIKRRIEAHLETDDLTAGTLGRQFGLSRASLYRLFEGDGGLTRYVQDRRLARALKLLVAPDMRHERLIDLAIDLRFSSDTTFVRAFRRQFGVTPGEIREISRAWLRDAGRAPKPAEVLRKLGRA
ncbi:helix-turn-helix domain-containing protein [Rhodoplanes sp. TEM]|uniref:Helix-turn-helix domain-containing protein n=1 Tax=Rhodoplanes tepidamans TaxID=200616 RepID=A0ABT5JAR1_RHOTP|nr:MULTISPECIES: helix-turn-helix domain-containing protein [Rhodoplanes]MDC7786528.1 helix-turn-helix domain-containing protein [Rhodoplanes tepidamans]MDC7983134.1 helix-turn-helix domain-containing protein [Rhodoplanes sp. TEM]MDQ0357592.1 AraC-like DNA-binding protein/mannose-6-phosphate isomerase-like protein (cupin superfamily) [Rhodoplanes tepidamans]